MASSTYYPRYKSYGDKNFLNNDVKRPNNSDERYYYNQSTATQAKSSYRQYNNNKSAWQYDNYYYQVDVKQELQLGYGQPGQKQKYSNYRKGSNSPASTLASEADQESEIAGFKIVQSGKILIDSQTSDSDSIFSPEETQEKKEAFRFASATKFLGPAPQAISLPSFV